MAVEPGYPITLVHPHHKDAVNITGYAPAQLERFPPVTVYGAESEAEHRARGYLRFGEPQPQTDYNEYPKILRHPDYKEEIPSRLEARIEDGKMVGTFQIPAVPAYMPDVMVKNVKEEKKWRAKDYKPAGEYNREALDSVINGTVPDEAFEVVRYPMWVEDMDKPLGEDGTRPKKILYRDPDAEEELEPTPDYPRWENGKLIQDPRFPEEPDPTKYPMWVHKDGIPSDDSVLVKNPLEEFKVRQKWAPLVADATSQDESVEDYEVNKDPQVPISRRRSTSASL